MVDSANSRPLNRPPSAPPAPAAAPEEERTDPNLVRPAEFTAKAPRPSSAVPPFPSPSNDAETAPPTAPPATGPRYPSLGPIDPLMADPEITEIMVNDLRPVHVERRGRLEETPIRFESLEELNRMIRNILEVTGRIVSPDQPFGDVVFADGSRVNIVVPPVSAAGPSVTIRKFPARAPRAEDLIRAGMLDQRMGHFLNTCVVGKANILISGGTGSGKTTMLGAIAGLIPRNERLVIIEDTPEIRIPHSNAVRMQTRPVMPNLAPITARDLVANALRMRPDRIIVGEVRKNEALDMLQAMNTGHEGSMTTLHANSPREALVRLETLCMMAGNAELPLSAIRRQIAGSIDLILQVHRFRSGARRLVSITEVTGMEGDTITLQDIFEFVPDPGDPHGGAAGAFRSLGLVPRFASHLKAIGIEFPPNYF